jgi:hypothetical protein
MLSSEYSLSIHQKTTKKCLIKQGIIPLGNFKCDICNENFLCKSVLKKHSISCNKKNNTELNIKIIPELKSKNTFIESKLSNIESKYNILKQKYDILRENQKKYESLEIKYTMLLEERKECKIDQKKYESLEIKYTMLLEERKEWKIEQKELLDKITTTALTKTNNTVNKNNININTYTRTDEELKNIYEENLTSLHIEGGISAITQLIVDKVVTDDKGVKMISITDKSRGTARYKLPSGEMVTDNGLTNFTTKNRNILMKKIYSIASEEDISKQILNDDTNISKGYTEISDDLDGCSLRNSLIKKL